MRRQLCRFFSKSAADPAAEVSPRPPPPISTAESSLPVASQPHFKQLFTEKGDYGAAFGMEDLRKEWGTSGGKENSSAEESGGGVKALLSRFSGSVSSSKCACCGKTAYPMESMDVDGAKYHKSCFKCAECNVMLSLRTFVSSGGKVYCHRDVPKMVAKAGVVSIALEKQLEAQKLASAAKGSSDIVARYGQKQSATPVKSAPEAKAAFDATGTSTTSTPAKTTPAKGTTVPDTDAEAEKNAPSPKAESAVESKAATVEEGKEKVHEETPTNLEPAPSPAPPQPEPEPEAAQKDPPAAPDAMNSTNVDLDVLEEATKVAETIEAEEEAKVDDILNEAKALGDDIENEATGSSSPSPSPQGGSGKKNKKKRGKK